MSGTKAYWRYAGLDSIGANLKWKLCRYPIPTPSRGGLGWGWVSSLLRDLEFSSKTHPHPNLPLEGEGVKSGDS